MCLISKSFDFGSIVHWELIKFFTFVFFFKFQPNDDFDDESATNVGLYPSHNIQNLGGLTYCIGRFTAIDFFVKCITSNVDAFGNRLPNHAVKRLILI